MEDLTIEEIIKAAIEKAFKKFERIDSEFKDILSNINTDPNEREKLSKEFITMSKVMDLLAKVIELCKE